MSKIKTVYDILLPDVKTNLRNSARKYNSAKRLKYTLMSKTMWNELTVDEMRDIINYSSISAWDLDYLSFMYGEKIINNE